MLINIKILHSLTQLGLVTLVRGVNPGIIITVNDIFADQKLIKSFLKVFQDYEPYPHMTHNV